MIDSKSRLARPSHGNGTREEGDGGKGKVGKAKQSKVKVQRLKANSNSKAHEHTHTSSKHEQLHRLLLSLVEYMHTRKQFHATITVLIRKIKLAKSTRFFFFFFCAF